MPESEVVTSEDALGESASAWDALAVAAGRPFCAPGWMRAWWRHLAPPGARLNVILIRDSGELIGVAPFVVIRGPLGLQFCRPVSHRLADRVGPVAAPGRESDVAVATVETLAHLSPAPDVLEIDGIDCEAPLTLALAERCPHSVRNRWADRPAPSVRLDGRTFDEWLDSKSPNFRHTMRKGRRRLGASGLHVSVGTSGGTISSDLEVFAELYRARWGKKGGRFDGAVVSMLEDVAVELAAEHRFRVACVRRAGGHPVGVCLFMAAGNAVSLWRGAFDDEWGRFQPGLQAVLAGIENACEGGSRRVDLGGGDQGWKSRLADETDTLTCISALLTPSAAGRLRLLQASAATRRTVGSRLRSARLQSLMHVRRTRAAR